MKGKLFRAGLLPYVIENDRVKFLLMKPSDARFGGPEFQIAKGKIEQGETEEEAAVREAEEELGLIRSNIGPVEFLGNYLGRTSMFITEVKDRSKFNKPHFETSETVWLSLPEFDIIGRKLHLHVIQEATRTIMRQRTRS